MCLLKTSRSRVSLFDTIYINNQAVRLKSYKELSENIGSFADLFNLDEEKTKMARQEPTLMMA